MWKVMGGEKGDGVEKRIRAENWEDKVDGGKIGEDGGGRWNEGAREQKMTETRWRNRGRQRIKRDGALCCTRRENCTWPLTGLSVV